MVNYDEIVNLTQTTATLSSQRETVSVSDYTGANRIKPNQ